MRAPNTVGSRLHALRLAKGLSQVELARHIGRHQTAIGPYERDEYEPPREVVLRLAELLDATPEYIYFGRAPHAASLALVGVIGPDRVRAAREPDGSVRDVRTERLIAYELQDDAMLPVFRPGQILLCSAQAAEDPTPLLGREALVTLRDGRRLLRRLTPGSRRGLVTLAAPSAPPLFDVALTAAHRVLGVLEPEALGAPRPRPPVIERRRSG